MNTLRLCEWSSVRADVSYWTRERREAVQQAATAWQNTHRLSALPLEWSGPDGQTLRSRQWVGIVEVAGARIEIYPKTDKALLHKNELNQEQSQTALHTLLRLLEASHYNQWLETERAALAVAELAFADVWAYLLARHLWPHLRRGLPSLYLPREDELTRVRGKILLGRQITRFPRRVDRVCCAWDEFSPDTALLRVFKSACRFLERRVLHPFTRALLADCLFLLDEVAELSAAEALRGSESLTWTRATERFRPAFDLARHVLQGQSSQMQSGSANIWVFLVDMNRVFESFARAALENKFGITVQEQKNIGWLLRENRLQQRPDYIWNLRGRAWIGDAKWKLLDKALWENETNSEARLSTADVRQLTTYAELLARRQALQNSTSARPELAIFYPGVGESSSTQVHRTWNDTRLHIVPLQITGWKTPKDALPADFDC